MGLLGKFGVFLVSFLPIILTAVSAYDLVRVVSCGWLLAPNTYCYVFWCEGIGWGFLRPDSLILIVFTLPLWALFVMLFVTQRNRFRVVACVWALCLVLCFVRAATQPLRVVTMDGF